jgi:hypothetical protein
MKYQNQNDLFSTIINFVSNTVKIFGGCAAGSRKRCNRRSNHAWRKSRTVPPAQLPDILTGNLFITPIVQKSLV